jgi:hypothetical protein
MVYCPWLPVIYIMLATPKPAMHFNVAVEYYQSVIIIAPILEYDKLRKQLTTKGKMRPLVSGNKKNKGDFNHKFIYNFHNI